MSKKAWINVYDTMPHLTKEHAEKMALKSKHYLCTVEVELPETEQEKRVREAMEWLKQTSRVDRSFKHIDHAAVLLDLLREKGVIDE